MDKKCQVCLRQAPLTLQGNSTLVHKLDLLAPEVETSSCLCSRFIEHGEYKENQYGTSIEAIRSVQAKNKMCVVDVQPEVSASRYISCPVCSNM